MNRSDYPPISDYAYLSDCHSAALVSSTGSIDWCCMPRVDSASCFGRLLDWRRGGFCRIVPSLPYRVFRQYLQDSLVLETTFTTDRGVARLIDCMPVKKGGKHHPYAQILRIVEGMAGSVELGIDIVPRFEYGTIEPWIRRRNKYFIAIGGSSGLLISGDMELELRQRDTLTGSRTLGMGERAHLSIVFRRPEGLDEGEIVLPSSEELDKRLEQTLDWWHAWASQGKVRGPYAPHVLRSAIVLKGLTNAPTGAMAAAPTTSLPEAPGGTRNWDYRFTWIRDSCFAVRSLAGLGYVKEADGFRRFVERTAANSAAKLQVLFGVGGETCAFEHEIDELEGYRGAKPVRIGNAAASQLQLDVYGELLDLAWRWHQRKNSPDEDYLEFIVELVNGARKLWRNPDRGIWEIRGEPRHFVHSKAMCWAALDRGIGLSEELGCKAPVNEWKRERDEIRRAIEEKGYDAARGVFIQAFDHPQMDAALLLLPVSGFISHTDERMVRTTDAIRESLSEDGLVRRYPTEGDGLEGKEGTFLACTFWLAEALARQGRFEEAHAVFKRALSTGNELGLFPEEYSVDDDEMLGNFPQGLTHLSLITAALALAGG
ncbi:MAG: glycoside hydrolase family 15 protein [Syntrophobacteraceae bacterium]